MKNKNTNNKAMEEVPDEIPDLEPAQEYEELEETIPEPPPLKRASKLTEKVTCEGCGKSLSLHAYKYSHKCKARAPEDPVPAPEPEVEEKPKKKPRVDGAKLAESLKELKPPRGSKAAMTASAVGGKAAMTEKQSIKPMKQRAVINRTPEYALPEPPYQPAQHEIYSHLMQQRQQQAYMRHQAMLAPYQQMFASRVR